LPALVAGKLLRTKTFKLQRRRHGKSGRWSKLGRGFVFVALLISARGRCVHLATGEEDTWRALKNKGNLEIEVERQDDS
jgi:hypothetical protein